MGSSAKSKSTLSVMFRVCFLHDLLSKNPLLGYLCLFIDVTKLCKLVCVCVFVCPLQT